MEFSGTTIFLAGMLVGNLLETRTTLVLVTIATIISNRPLPELLGGVTPQTLLRGMFIRIGRTFKRIASEDFPKNNTKKELDDLNSNINVQFVPKPRTISIQYTPTHNFISSRNFTTNHDPSILYNTPVVSEITN